MATFKVGQRVKFARRVSLPCLEQRDLPLGAEGTVLGPDDWGMYDYTVAFDVCPNNHNFCFASELAPLTDPRAEEFIGDMERFAIAALPVKVRA